MVVDGNGFDVGMVVFKMLIEMFGYCIYYFDGLFGDFWIDVVIG